MFLVGFIVKVPDWANVTEYVPLTSVTAEPLPAPVILTVEVFTPDTSSCSQMILPLIVVDDPQLVTVTRAVVLLEQLPDVTV